MGEALGGKSGYRQIGGCGTSKTTVLAARTRRVLAWTWTLLWTFEEPASSARELAQGPARGSTAAQVAGGSDGGGVYAAPPPREWSRWVAEWQGMGLWSQGST